MCVIFYLRPGIMLPDNMIQNACWNNPDGYGITVRADGKLWVIKDLPEKGNDPEVIQRLLEENKDADRFVHVRWKTQGDISKENTQPFEVYSSKKKDIVFMHNGTLHTVYPKALEEHLKENKLDGNEVSDSRKFAFGYLSPMLTRFKGANGEADINDTFFIDWLNKVWSHNNRGLIVSSIDEPLYLGDWKVVKIPDTDIEFPASNNDYFYRLSRGVKYEEEKKLAAEREARERAERRRATVENAGKAGEVPLVGAGRLSSPPFQKRYKLSEKGSAIFNDVDLLNSTEGFQCLKALTLAECEKIMEEAGEDAGLILLTVTGHLSDLADELVKYKDKVEKATKRIATLVQEKEGYATTATSLPEETNQNSKREPAHG